MRQVTKIRPPAELSPRIVPLSDPRVDLTARRRGDIQAAVVHWRDLVLATWQLPADRQYTGTLPDGMTVYRFSAKVGQAAKRLGGRVGVAVRGRRWWVWTMARPTLQGEENGHRD